MMNVNTIQGFTNFLTKWSNTNVYLPDWQGFSLSLETKLTNEYLILWKDWQDHGPENFFLQKSTTTLLTLIPSLHEVFIKLSLKPTNVLFPDNVLINFMKYVIVI